MADIKNQIAEDVKVAMRGRDKEKLAVLRLIQAALKQKEVDERIELSNEQTIAILDRMARQHREAIAQFSQAERDDLVTSEQFGLKIMEAYLPAKLSEDEINQIINVTISGAGAKSMKDMGKVMGLLKGKLQGRADMGKVSSLIKARLDP